MVEDHDDRLTAGANNRSDVESCARSHRALVDHLRSLGEIDPTTPSRLPGWSVGHVLTHLARNGDSHLDMLAGRPQYPSVASRDADIAAGATRGWSELLDDVERAGTAVVAAFAALTDWSGSVSTVTAERPRELLPLLRQREVELHRVDLGLGHEFGDLPADYVRRDLRVLEMVWTARQPMGLTTLPDAVLSRPPYERLAWLTGRIEIPGAASGTAL